MSELQFRLAVRALVVDPEGSALLVRFDFPGSGVIWATPGGGMEPGETEEETLRRELEEELGLTSFELGPLLWRRTLHFVVPHPRWAGQHDAVFLVRTERFEPRPRLTWAQLNAEAVTALAWWTPAEVDASAERFAPRSFPELYRHISDHGPPSEPFEVGV